jgi:hypothetical protein
VTYIFTVSTALALKPEHDTKTAESCSRVHTYCLGFPHTAAIREEHYHFKLKGLLYKKKSLMYSTFIIFSPKKMCITRAKS